MRRRKKITRGASRKHLNSLVPGIAKIIHTDTKGREAGEGDKLQSNKLPPEDSASVKYQQYGNIHHMSLHRMN